MTKQYRRPVMASIHEPADGLHAVGIMDEQIMRKCDDACLTPVRVLNPAEIRALRVREGASQAGFARYVNVTTTQAADPARPTPGAPALKTAPR
jgi:putative transcriptional regulator